MSARHPRPWEWEEHELSEGMSCIVYDARGHRVGGLDHLDRETAAEICDRPRATSAALNVPVRSRAQAARDIAKQALDDIKPTTPLAQSLLRTALMRIATILGEAP